MVNQKLVDYYVNQAGGGLSYFEGQRFQRGDGFFDTLKSLAKTGLPLFKYLSKQALETGTDVAKDILSGDSIKTALKERAKAKLRDIAGDLSERAAEYQQTGRGKRRKISRRKSNKIKKKKSKKSKRKSKIQTSIF